MEVNGIHEIVFACAKRGEYPVAARTAPTVNEARGCIGAG